MTKEGNGKKPSLEYKNKKIIKYLYVSKT